jgi:predicted DNA-binding transcriptional regulator YafY
MPPLILTPDEIEAVMLGAQWVASRSDKALGNAARDVMAKIAAVVPEHLRPLILEPSVGVKPMFTEPTKESVDPSRLRSAIREGRKLRMRYRSDAGEETERTVWPVILGYAETTRMLVAWCELRQGFRHFRTDCRSGNPGRKHWPPPRRAAPPLAALARDECSSSLRRVEVAERTTALVLRSREAASKDNPVAHMSAFAGSSFETPALRAP